MAKAVRETAAKTTDPVIKIWEDGARQHEARAKEQRDETARPAPQAPEKTATGQQGGAAPSPDPGAKTASPPASPPGAPPIATRTAAQPAPGPASAAAAGTCPAGPASADTALPIDAIAGSWRSDDGKEVVKIAPKQPVDTSKFVLRSRQFEWEGTYDGARFHLHPPSQGPRHGRGGAEDGRARRSPG